MIRKVMNSDRPMRTWLGGNCCVPTAWRSRERTMMIRVKLVIISRMAGARERTVRKTTSWRVAEKFSRLVRSGTLSGSSCAGGDDGAGAVVAVADATEGHSARYATVRKNTKLVRFARASVLIASPLFELLREAADFVQQALEFLARGNRNHGRRIVFRSS